MSRLHVLTACSRPENLAAVAESIDVGASITSWEACWHVRFDLDRVHVGGQRLKNQMLDQIGDGWVCFLDDDTTLHPQLAVEVEQAIARDRRLQAVVVSQERADGRHLAAAPENLRVGEIDIGQAVLRRDLIGDRRIPEFYEGDGLFLADVLADARVVYLDESLSRHNALLMMPA